MSNVVKKGDVRVLQGSEWACRFCLLTCQSPGVVYFDIYPSESCYLERPKHTDRRRVARVHKGESEVVGELDTLTVHSSDTSHNQPLTISIGDPHQLTEWLEAFTSQMVMTEHSATNGLHCNEKYDIVVDETTGSKQCRLKVGVASLYQLLLQATQMCLIDVSGGKTLELYSWPYKYVRRYGRTSTSFTFEAGRKCESGEGMFTFKVNNGELLFNEVHMKTKAMKGTSSQSMSQPVSSSLPHSSPPTSPPVLPARNYSHDTVKQLEKVNEQKKSPSAQRSNKQHGVIGGIKEHLGEVKEGVKHLKDDIKHTLHRKSHGDNDRKSRTSLGTDYKDEDIHMTMADVSPNMQHRKLPEVPKSVKSVKSSNDNIYEDYVDGDVFEAARGTEYQIYDKEFSSQPRPWKKTLLRSDSTDIYDKHTLESASSAYMVASEKKLQVARSVSSRREPIADDDEQETYSSVPEGNNKYHTHTSSLKMSALLDSATPETPTEVGHKQEDYMYTYEDQYNSISFLSDPAEKRPSVPVVVEDEAAYGTMSLAPEQSDQQSIGYINTSRMSEIHNTKQ